MSAAESGLAFEALADPTRRTILRVLGDRGELNVGEIAAEVNNVGRTAVSSHLRILRSAGLVNERRDGRYRLYSVDGDSLHDVVQFLGSLYRAPLEDLKNRGAPAAEPGTGE
jgi:ArsR family transcriptional regulator, arsenate/arsenite/antimonite-responsive transcriptional repressor